MQLGLKKKRPKMHIGNKEILNNDSMMNIKPFLPSDIYSDVSYDHIKSHSSMSRDGNVAVYTMIEQLRDFDPSSERPHP
jgi:hypothetical protein